MCECTGRVGKLVCMCEENVQAPINIEQSSETRDEARSAAHSFNAARASEQATSKAGASSDLCRRFGGAAFLALFNKCV